MVLNSFKIPPLNKHHYWSSQFSFSRSDFILSIDFMKCFKTRSHKCEIKFLVKIFVLRVQRLIVTRSKALESLDGGILTPPLKYWTLVDVLRSY
jgi:hypothetical protein